MEDWLASAQEVAPTGRPVTAADLFADLDADRA